MLYHVINKMARKKTNNSKGKHLKVIFTRSVDFKDKDQWSREFAKCSTNNCISGFEWRGPVTPSCDSLKFSCAILVEEGGVENGILYEGINEDDVDLYLEFLCISCCFLGDWAVDSHLWSKLDVIGMVSGWYSTWCFGYWIPERDDEIRDVFSSMK